MAKTAYWASFYPQVAAAAGVPMNFYEEILRCSGYTGVISALCVATSLFSVFPTQHFSSLPAIGMTLVHMILEALCSLDAPIVGEEDEWRTFSLQIVDIFQVQIIVDLSAIAS